MEENKALKMLSVKDIDKYVYDKSKVIKEAAIMLKEFSESDKAERMRLERKREEYERNHQLTMAEEKGIAKGEAKGKAEGEKVGMAKGEEKKQMEVIETMHKNGADIKTISKLLNLDEKYVESVLKA